MTTVTDVINRNPAYPIDQLPAPAYRPAGFGPKIGMAVESMSRHMTDEGWQLFLGLEAGGYSLVGHNIASTLDDGTVLDNVTDAGKVVALNPSVVVMQDKREWEGLTAGGVNKGFNRSETFTNVGAMRGRDDVFKLTVLKDSQNNRSYHRQSADEIGCHAWVVYYHPDIIKHLAPYVRREHLVRTYHTVDPSIVPDYTHKDRKSRAMLSGALSRAYPLRVRLYKHKPGNVDYRFHPGYHRRGCDTPMYLLALTHYKVAICTSSVYGYALRKIVEATAAGCRVITDLPAEDVMPHIDGNLHRVSSDVTFREMEELVTRLCKTYSPSDQAAFVDAAARHYDYKVVGKKLADDIDSLMQSYGVAGE